MAPTGHRVDGLRIARARQSLTDGRTEKPLSQAAFAKRLGIHPVTMSNIENGKANVSLDLLERIADETGTTRDDLLASGDDGDEEEDEPVSELLMRAAYHLDKAGDYEMADRLRMRVRRAKSIADAESLAKEALQ
jgi:transcriptional regulator with XRE-family HTH domain